MSNGSSLKRGSKALPTKKMVTDRMDDMAALMTAMEATLMEWEIWLSLIKGQKKYLSQEQWEIFVSEGPVFTEFPQKIMDSVRAAMPKFETKEPEKEQKKMILGTDGLPTGPEVERPKIII